MPTVRSSVLLPDMFEPLTTSSCVGATQATSLRTARAAGSSGWPRPRPSKIPVRPDRGRLDDLWKRIVRMFESIGGERRERFELADRVEPQAHVTAVRAAPFFDRPRDVRAPHEGQREDQEEEIVLPVVQLDQAMECANGARRG